MSGSRRVAWAALRASATGMAKRKERAAAPVLSANLLHHAKPTEDEEDIGEPAAELGELEAEAVAEEQEAEAAEAPTPVQTKELGAPEAAAEAVVPTQMAAPEAVATPATPEAAARPLPRPAVPAGRAAQAAAPPNELDALALSLVEVRDTGSAKGLGLFARQELADNTWVGDYVGEVLSQDAYLLRYPNEDAAYVLSANTDYNIDAADPARSSFLRYANHSSDFNMIYTVLRVRGRREKHVKFYTTRRVLPGEELVFDYGEQYWTKERNLRPLP